eukprot:gnl/MRDRNA2_/MRDRNA2_178630_c0_seq1.p1 gnl/MRDRNA2_/MRDRNA2_178630_c0~~gnl/MRDRNA2_/MRDRNA2_178630_c0_seq1.p1  ORF type:complete len:519 (+),score=99.16 gnl/MRDRNA2_/MRDRNA2_178630_c0_seq1:92-1558(+)
MTVAPDHSTIEFSVNPQQGTQCSNWPQVLQQPLQFVQCSQSEAYGCPPGNMILVSPFPLQMDLNGQMGPYLCPSEQNGFAQMPQFPMMFCGSHAPNCMPQQGTFAWAAAAPASSPCTVGSGTSQCVVGTCVPMNKEQQNLQGCQIIPAQWFTESQPRTEEAYSQNSSRSSEHSTSVLANSDTQAHHDQDVAELLGEPLRILRDRDFASEVQKWLEDGNSSECKSIIEWLLPNVMDLSLSQNGTQVIQAALKVGSTEDQERLGHCLRGRLKQLLDSPQGNFVLQQSVVSMPRHIVKSMIEELSYYHGGWAAVSKHRFGCRVAERILERWDEELTTPLVNSVLADVASTSRNLFANYVVQHIMEHGAPRQRIQVVLALKRVGISNLAQHRVASNIVEKAVEHGDADAHQLLATAILEDRGSVVALADNRYGSYAIRRLVDVLKEEPLKSQLLRPLLAAETRLRTTKHGRQVLARARAVMDGKPGYGLGGA